MVNLTFEISDELHGALKIRLAEINLKNKRKDKKAASISAKKFINDLLEKELGIKK